MIVYTCRNHVLESLILDSKYSKMTPKFVKQKSQWLHSSIKFANPGPFIYLPWFWTLQIPSNCFKYTVFLVWINNHLFRKFCWLFHSHKKRLLLLLSPFTDGNDSFSYPLMYFNLWNLYPFMYWYDRPIIAIQIHACKVEKRNMFICILCLHLQHLCNLQGCTLVITH